jgi:hypothetical protein
MLASSSYVNVRSAPYKARGDGMADDCPAIQRAIDAALAAGGGIVHFPTGRYLLKSGHLSVAGGGAGRNLTLMGEGSTSSVLVLGGPGACILDWPGGESRDLELKNLGFDAAGYWASSCVALATFHGLSIEGCAFGGTASRPALMLGRAQNYYDDPPGSAASTGVRVTNCRFPRHRGAGAYEAVRFAAVDGGALSGCEFDDFDCGAVLLHTYCFNFSITDNVFRDAHPGAFDIVVENSGAMRAAGDDPSIVIARNRHIFAKGGSKSIVIGNCVNVLVENEIIRGTVTQGEAPKGILVLDWCDGADSHPLVNPDSHDIVIRKNDVRDTYEGVGIAPSLRSHNRSFRMWGITIEDNTFSGQLGPVVQIGCPTVQDVHHVKVARNRMELPRSPAAPAIDVVGNPGYPAIVLEQDVKGTPSLYASPKTVWVSEAEGTVDGECLEIGSGPDRETIEIRAVSRRKITTRFWKDHRAGEKLLPSATGNGISQIRLVQNVVEAGRASHADSAISIKDAQVEEISGNDLRAAKRGLVLLRGGIALASDI